MRFEYLSVMTILYWLPSIVRGREQRMPMLKLSNGLLTGNSYSCLFRLGSTRFRAHALQLLTVL